MSSTSTLFVSDQLRVDELLRSIYTYYQCGGFNLILIMEMGKLIMLFFTAALTLAAAMAPWDSILKCNDVTSCADVESYMTEGLERNSSSLLVSTIRCLSFALLFSQVMISAQKVSMALRMRRFYRQSLQIINEDFDTLKWNDIMQRIVAMQDQYDILLVSYRHVSAFEIVSRIMRKDNYCIALLSGNIVNLELPQWAVINQTSSASTVTRSYYNKWVEKLLYYAFIDRLHLPNGKLDESFLNRTDVIISQFRMLGYFTVLAAPFVATLVAYVFALENFQRFYSNREHLSERGWTSLSLWQFRDFNELPHTFDRRMKLAYVPAELYVSGHHNRYHSIIGKVICFITGSLITLLLLLSVFDEDILLRVHYRQHNLLWYLGTISVVYAVFRSWTPDYRTRHYHANRLMEQLIGSLHSVPSHWLRLCDTNRVREEVSAIFAYKLKLFFAEIMTILVVPILLLHSIPNSIPHMVDCIRRGTCTSEELGDNCAFSSLNATSFDPLQNSEWSESLLQKAAGSATYFKKECGIDSDAQVKRMPVRTITEEEEKVDEDEYFDSDNFSFN